MDFSNVPLFRKVCNLSLVGTSRITLLTEATETERPVVNVFGFSKLQLN